jgi:hypothetical protein
LPPDVVKLPAAAAQAGFPSAVVNLPAASFAAAAVATNAAPPVAPPAAPPASTMSAPAMNLTGTLGKLVGNPGQLGALTPVDLSPAVVAGGVLITPQAASTPADGRSMNRFAEFESGVLFWLRGATSAIRLSPAARTADGTKLAFTGAEIATAAADGIGIAALQGPNVQLAGIRFVATAAPSFDGAQVHNRRHRLALAYAGVEPGAQGPSSANVELQVEVRFEPDKRRIALVPVDWTLTQSSSFSYGEMVRTTLAASLDPLLWSSFELVSLPDTDAGAPIAVLCVKTLADGSVGTYIEPRDGIASLSFLVGKVPFAIAVADTADTVQIK